MTNETDGARPDLAETAGELTAEDVNSLQRAVSNGQVLFGTVTIQHASALRILSALRSRPQ